MTRYGCCTGILVAAGLLLGARSGRAAECRFDRNLTVNGAGTLDATTGSGDLKVVAGDNTRVHVLGVVHSGGLLGGSHDEVQRICDAPPIEQSGNAIRVGVEPNDWLRHVSVDYTIEVPRAFAVRAGSGSGDVLLGGLGGAVSGTTGSGDVKASVLGGGAQLNTGSGTIDASGLSGNTRLQTGSGDIHATFQGPGDVRATSGSGEIRLENVEGGLVAHTASGGVELSGTPRSAWQIGTSSGDVKLHLRRDVGFTLDAASASGNVQTSVPITVQGSLGEHHLHAPVNGGGPEVQVQTASGDIQLN